AAALAVFFVVFSFGSEAGAKPLNVVATTSMLADAVIQVAGPRAEVTALMGPGIDPHSYRPPRSDIVRMTRADLVIWHDLDLEVQLQEFLADLGRRKPIVALGEAVDEARLRASEAYPDRFDPHIWMDPDLWATVIEAA